MVDLYELTMAAVYVDEGIATAPATFSLFARPHPESGYLVAAGLGPVLEAIERFRIGPAEVDLYRRAADLPNELLAFLDGLSFDGAVRAVPEGRVVLPEEPLLEIDAPLVAGQLLETFVLNQVTLHTTLATGAARIRHAAGDHAVVDFALRRALGVEAGMALTRACAIVGLAGTSNVAGADAFGLPANGTMAHSFVQAHEREVDAFRAFVRRFRDRSVLLVDTYDTIGGVAAAIAVAEECRANGFVPRGVRLDSGDLGALARRARHMLDEAGLREMQVFVSGGLDAALIDRLVSGGAPIDGFGVGSALATGMPAIDAAYKLVEVDGRPVRKTSERKANWPGRKQIWRTDRADFLALADERSPVPDAEALLVDIGPDYDDSVAAAHDRFETDWNRLPDATKRLVAPDPPEVGVSDGLRRLTDAMAPAPRSPA